MDGVFSGWHWIIVAIVLVALFGAAKLPVFARSLGQSMRIFKSEVRGMMEDDAVAAPPATGTVPTVIATPPAAAYQPVVQPPALAQPAAPAAAAATEPQYVIGADGQKYVLQPVTDQPQTGQH